MSLKQPNDEVNVDDWNDMLQLFPGTTPPGQPALGEVWLDTSAAPYRLKRYNGTDWDIVAGGITVTSTGEIGIGTTSPSYPIHLSTNGTNATMLLEQSSGATAIVTGGNSGVNIGSQTDHDVRFVQNGITKMVLKTDGKFGVGTTTPSDPIHLQTDNSTDAFLIAERTDGATVEIGATSTLGQVGTRSNHDLEITTNDTMAIQVKADGNVGIGTTTPTAKLEAAGSIVSIMHQETIADTGIHDTGINRESVGHLYLHNATGGIENGATFSIGMIMTSNNGVTRTGGSSSIYSNTKDTASRINVYAEATGNIKIQNNRGASRTIQYGFFGAKI
ncbi:MAG: hypothetical protein GY940_30370 [bacterium]|nr:hypothetical protein [bacterium]